jgi:hypothetical protein
MEIRSVFPVVPLKDGPLHDEHPAEVTVVPHPSIVGPAPQLEVHLNSKNSIAQLGYVALRVTVTEVAPAVPVTLAAVSTYPTPDTLAWHPEGHNVQVPPPPDTLLMCEAPEVVLIVCIDTTLTLPAVLAVNPDIVQLVPAQLKFDP